MDSARRHIIWVLVLWVLIEFEVVKGNVVFEVHHKFGKKGNAPIGVLKAHDSRRHGRSLGSLDFQLGGDGSPTNAALYYTKIAIGTPPVNYHVQVDTGSDILWVNCHNCDKCPTKSDLDIPLVQYNMKASSTGQIISCDQEFCGTVFSTPNPNCKVGMNCEYAVTYGDGSKTEGYFVRDNFKFDQVTGNLQTTAMNGSIAFGCSAKQSGELGSSSQAVDGIVGFGQANTSILSQLALSGKVKKIFSHCLDGKKGGGIFAVGEVVQPKVDRTPLVPDQSHYNVIVKGVQVGDKHINLPTGLFGAGPPRRAIIDSGTTLAYLPSDIYEQVLNKMVEQQPEMKIHMVEDEFKCFWYTGNVDNGFPVITFQFDNSLTLPVYPHSYLFEVRDTEYCIGWQRSGMQATDGQELTLLGDIALSDNLVVYDLENQTIGWTQYNCSSSIKVKNEATGNARCPRSRCMSSGSYGKCSVLEVIVSCRAVSSRGNHGWVEAEGLSEVESKELKGLFVSSSVTDSNTESGGDNCVAGLECLLNIIRVLTMGSCFSCESRSPLPSSTTGVKRRKASTRRALSQNSSSEYSREDRLHRDPNRMFLNGSSEIASLFTQQGKKGINQDAMIVWENFGSRTDTVFCGVFDGHGPYGHMVAKRVRDSLPLKLSAHWEVDIKDDEILREVSVNTTENWCIKDGSFLSAGGDVRASVDPGESRALKESFLKAFKVMDKELRMNSNFDCICSGTTAVTLVKQGRDLIIGNVGDSRAVLATRGPNDELIPVQLTVDLKPNLPAEEERIRKCRGRIFALRDEPEVARVWLPDYDTPGLAMARAFGDFCLKEFGLISVPEMSYRRITDKDEFVILATDGIWDVLSNEEVVSIVGSCSTHAYAARAVVDSAVRAWRCRYPSSKVDDCAVVCLLLNSYEHEDI
ncbi:Protein phosphatase 2C family protein [Perilla frutescens var. frutescens]|nr:Protein phosphatase 2C family protein [Perilla frutescens var. frutescens]